MKQINWAYDQIKDAQSRRTYRFSQVFNPEDGDPSAYAEEFLNGFTKTLRIGLVVAAVADVSILGYRFYKSMKRRSNVARK